MQVREEKRKEGGVDDRMVKRGRKKKGKDMVLGRMYEKE